MGTSKEQRDKPGQPAAGGRRATRRTTAAPPEADAVAVHVVEAQGSPACLPSGEHICVEVALQFERIVLVAGWASASVSLRIPGLLGQRGVRRQDAEQIAGHKVVGFVVAMAGGGDGEPVSIQAGGAGIAARIPLRPDADPGERQRGVERLLPLLAPLLPPLLQAPDFAALLFAACPELPAAMRTRVQGFVDEVQTFRGFGCVSYGWAITCDEYQFWLAGAGGTWRPLREAMRYNRADVDSSFGQDFGPHTAQAGFFCALPGAGDGELRLIAAGPAGCFTVHGRSGRAGPADPLTYARWAFSLPTPFSRFGERLDRHDGALLAQLIQARRRKAPEQVESWDCGAMPASPSISVVVPLYGDLRFVEHQLVEFCDDEDFRSGRSELIYVLDDPRIVEEMRCAGDGLYRLYGLPFRVVWGGYNRGYSGANNLGMKAARGEVLVLLNSDVFPLQQGWSQAMREVLDSRPDVCAVGARLEYPDGSLQHCGMRFEYSEALSAWLNRHPGQGLECPPRPGPPLAVPAATGACLAVRRRELLALGGMDEEYLIGDFEDSDLCLRLAGERRRVVVLPDTRMVHLERQSFALLGSPDFRLSVTRYNAWRHGKRWGPRIAQIMEEFAA